MEHLDGWFFYYDKESGWAATPREHKDLIFNDFKSELVLRSDSIDTLMDLISKAKGDIHSEFIKSIK